MAAESGKRNEKQTAMLTPSAGAFTEEFTAERLERVFGTESNFRTSIFGKRKQTGWG